MVQISSSVINLGHQPSSPGQHCITTSSSSRISCRVARKVELSSNSLPTGWLYHTPCNPPSPVCRVSVIAQRPVRHWFSYSSSSLYNSVPLPTSPYHPTITWFYLAPRRTTQNHQQNKDDQVYNKVRSPIRVKIRSSTWMAISSGNPFICSNLNGHIQWMDHHQSVAELMDLNSREVHLIYIYLMGEWI